MVGPKVAKALGTGHTPASVSTLHLEHVLHLAPKRRQLSKQAKIASMIVAALVAVVALVLYSTSQSPQMAVLTGLMEAAGLEQARNVPDDEKGVIVTKDSLEALLKATLTPGVTKTPARVYLALRYAKVARGSDVDVDATIVTFVLRQFTNDHSDTQLLEVLRKRKNPRAATPLLEFCRTTDKPKAALAAIQVCRTLAAEDDFAKFIDIIDFTGNPAIRQAAEDAAAAILKKSSHRLSLGIKVSNSHATATHAEVKYALIRLLGCVGGSKAAATVTAALAATDKDEQLAAAMALASWPDDSMFERLINYLGTLGDAPSRALVFDACVRFVANPNPARSPENNLKLWDLLASNAKSPAEITQVARARAASKK